MGFRDLGVCVVVWDEADPERRTVGITEEQFLQALGIEDAAEQTALINKWVEEGQARDARQDKQARRSGARAQDQ